MANAHIFIENSLLLIVIFVHLSQSQTINACINDITLIGTEKNMANILDIIPGSSVFLTCRFCSQRQNYDHISWSYRKRGSNKTIPVSKKGFSATPNYDLFLGNFTIDDSGVFTCKTPDLNDDDGINTFILDGVDKDSDDRVGSWEQWQNYKSTILSPINRILTDLTKELMLEFSFRLFTAWYNWEACKRIGNNEAKRRKRGKCRLHAIDRHIKIKAHLSNNSIKKLREFFLNDNYDVSCYSLSLRFYLPEISDVVRYLPEFIVTESCDMVPNNEGTILQQRMEPDDKAIVKKVTERDHITLTCPKATLHSKVEWFKDNNLINSIYSKNSKNSLLTGSDGLYISHASKLQEGLYSCIVDGRKAQTYDLKVLCQSALLNDDFFRYSIYLGFILSLTITCYCTGVCVAWHRKTSFADPLNLNNKNNNQ